MKPKLQKPDAGRSGPAAESRGADVPALSVEPAESARPGTRPATAQHPPTVQDIERRAFELYLGRAGSAGSAMDDWLLAERELWDTYQASVPIRACRGGGKCACRHGSPRSGADVA